MCIAIDIVKEKFQPSGAEATRDGQRMGPQTDAIRPIVQNFSDQTKYSVRNASKPGVNLRVTDASKSSDGVERRLALIATVYLAPDFPVFPGPAMSNVECFRSGESCLGHAGKASRRKR
ncbi:hypothetical protein D3C85_1293440 [compost metagenome]